MDKKTANSKKKITDYDFKTEFDTLGKVLASPNKKKILHSVDLAKTPKEISLKTNLNFATVSKNLKELEGLKLIKIFNKDFKRGKIITVSKKGKEVINDLIKKEKD